MTTMITVNELKKRAMKVPKYVANRFLRVLSFGLPNPCATSVCLRYDAPPCKRCPMSMRNYRCAVMEFERLHRKTWRKHARAIANWRLKQKRGKKC